MASVLALAAESLRTPCTLEAVQFRTTADLPGLATDTGVPGQERARDAVEFGVGLRAAGYNVFVLGPPGVGKRTLVLELVHARADAEGLPDDWVYVQNFAQPHRPRALRLPHGSGVGFRDELRRFAEDARASIAALFESDEYRNRAEQIDTEITEQQHQAFESLGADAAAQQIALIQTPMGFSLAPVTNEEVMTNEQFTQLPPEEKARIESSMRTLQERLQKVIRQVQQLQKTKRSRIKDLGRDMCQTTVAALVDDLRRASADLPGVLDWLKQLQADVLEHLDQFRRNPDAEPNPMVIDQEQFFSRYDVNVVIGDCEGCAGAPVESEDNPTYQNLLGRIEYVARFGTLVTDHNQIKPGALHRANGGYLLLDAQRLLTQPYAWDGLKRALRTGEIRTESIGQAYGLISTAALEPEPIPLDVKVFLFGDRMLYYLLVAYDQEFRELFRVPADFEDEVDRTPEREALYAQLIATIARREGWLPLERAAVARTIEEAARWAGDAQRVSAHLEDLIDLLHESDFRARGEGAEAITAQHLQGAIDGRRRRSGRVRERVHDAIRRGDLHIATTGEVTGQVNGLSVSMSADQVFAFPTRITANTRMGDAGVVDIQREVALSGPIHSKGVLILSSLLATRYSPERPPSLSATLVFEQTYGSVDGDSASIAELCALLSSLGGFPLRQGIAVTGAVDQHGRALPIGAVNEKIEGYFDVCRARGLTGEQGVVIPASNVRHLMLRSDVVEAVAAGHFSVYAVASVDEALGVLSGLDPDAANELVADRLEQLSAKRLEYLKRASDLEKSATAAPEPVTPTPQPEPPAPEPPTPPREPIGPPTPPPQGRP
ncbi:MAG: AAA family ATPase [Acidobacteriota bacterium]|nr:AAA family ATPase [Acidobacteriota bacterium]